MRENRDFVVPVNILTTFAHAPFSWAARHTTVCLDTTTNCSTSLVGTIHDNTVARFPSDQRMKPSNAVL